MTPGSVFSRIICHLSLAGNGQISFIVKDPNQVITLQAAVAAFDAADGADSVGELVSVHAFPVEMNRCVQQIVITVVY